MGKVWELAQLQRRTRGAAPYDLVIVDAPATGHGVGILRTPKTFAEIARVGPIAHQGRRSPRRSPTTSSPAWSRWRPPRRCRSTRRCAPGRDHRRRTRAQRRDRQRRVPGALRRGRGRGARRGAEAHASKLGRGAVNAALSEHARAAPSASSATGCATDSASSWSSSRTCSPTTSAGRARRSRTRSRPRRAHGTTGQGAASAPGAQPRLDRAIDEPGPAVGEVRAGEQHGPSGRRIAAW